MAITNRDLDLTERRHNATVVVNTTVTGTTYPLMVVPFPAMLVSAGEVNFGVSGAPVHTIECYRFLPGVGMTNFPVGSSQVVYQYGSSTSALYSSATYSCLGVTFVTGLTNSQGYTGYVGFTVIGATYALQQGDVLALQTAAANTATTSTAITLVLQALQDIRLEFGT